MQRLGGPRMGLVTIFLSISAGASIALAAGCLFLWLMDRRDPVSLMLFIFSAAASATIFVELGMLHSATVAEYGAWARWHHLPAFFSLSGQILFVYFYLRRARLWLAGTLIVMRLIVLIVNFSVEPNFNYSRIISLRQATYFGEHVSGVGAAVTRAGWQEFAAASLVLLIIYLLDATVRQWRMGGREAKRKALVIALGMVVPQLCGVLFNQLIIFGFVHAPIVALPWLLSSQLVMAYELGRDFLISKRAAVELVELQGQFAQMERVSMLGQLTSALTHELAQPMGASAINAHTALQYLECENPDLKKLRAILTDIHNDSQDNIELLSKLRQMFKNRPIELQPLKMQQIVQDVVRLIGNEAASNNISLSLALQPDLPLILGDRVHIGQVLLNLLMNSIHALQSCAPDARRIVVEARADNAKGAVEVTVRDFGHGIPDDIVNKVFAPFFTTKTEGMGVGLTLSRKIIEAHGGNLWADQSPKQGGAIFHFTLQQA
jgi:signal transduction histidine kinase